MSAGTSRTYGRRVVLASWLAVFCLFGYRATFAILKGPIALTLGWSGSQVTLGFSVMMVAYAVTAWLCGMVLDRWGTKPVYAIAAVLGGLGFCATSLVHAHLAYLCAFGVLGGVATGMLWVTSTVSVRTWYVGKSYATMWGFAFAGAPMAQFALAQLVKPRLSAAQLALDEAVRGLLPGGAALEGKELALAVSAKLRVPATLSDPAVLAAMSALEAAWRGEMRVLGVVVFLALGLAVAVAKNAPQTYGMRPFGELPLAAAGAGRPEYVWGTREAFSKYAIWAAILTFLTSMMGEFLVWTQMVSYWTQDVGFTLAHATDTYAIVGLVGLFSMPLMGMVADRTVKAVGDEVKGRKLMLIAGPSIGAVACALLLSSRRSDAFAYAACFVFALYWAIVPGGVVGYAGAVYGGATLGRIWGLATLIVMGVGPFLGSFLGGWLRDLSGSYTWSMWYALASFGASIVLATTLPLRAEHRDRAAPVAAVP